MAKETNSPSRMISLKASDGIIFEVEAKIAMEMQTVKYFIDEFDHSATIPLHNVNSNQLAMIIEFCKKQSETMEAKMKFEVEFAERLSNDELKELVPAADYLNIKSFFNFLSLVVASRIKDKSVEFVRKFLGIENDFTPEEEIKLRKKCEWAYEGVDKDED